MLKLKKAKEKERLCFYTQGFVYMTELAVDRMNH